MSAESSIPGTWTRRRFAAIVMLAALGTLVTLPAWLDIARIAWLDEEASHVLIVPLVAGWVAWTRRQLLRACPPGCTWGGPLLVLAGGVLAAWGYRHATQAAWHLGALLVVGGCTITLLGRPAAAKLLPALLLLIFVVPVPGLLRQRISIPLMTATAAATDEICRAAGIELRRSGNRLEAGGRPITVVEACNGLRLVFTLALVSCAFAFSEPAGPLGRCLIIAASPILAILCNTGRLVSTVILHAAGYVELADSLHAAAGWITVGAAFLLNVALFHLLQLVGLVRLPRSEELVSPCIVSSP